MAAKSELQIVINADDKASRKIGGIGKALRGLKAAGKIAKVALLGVVAVAATVAIGIGRAVTAAADFEEKMREVNTLVNLGEGEFKGLTDQMLELSKQTGTATEQLAGGLYQAISAGIPADNALDFMTIASKAAIGGVTDVETVIDGLTTVVNAFGLEASDAEKVSDILFTTVKLGKTKMADLSASMFMAAPIAAALGLGIEDVMGATATLTKSGVPTSVAMTQIRAALQALTKPTAEMEKLFAKMGVESGKAALETFGFQGTLEKLQEVTGGSETALVKAMGRVEGFSAVLGLTGKNSAVARADLEAMGKAGGATQTAFEEMNKSFNAQWGILKNKLSVQLQKTGLDLIQKIVPWVEKLSGAYDDWTDTSDQLKKAWDWFKESGDFIGALDLLSDKFPKITKKLAFFYLKAMDIKRVALALVDRFKAMLKEGGQLKVFFAGLATAGRIAFEELVTHFESLRDWFLGVLPSVLEFGQGLLDIVSPIVIENFQRLLDGLQKLGEVLPEMTTGKLGELSIMFTEKVVPALQQAWEFLKILGAVIVDTVKPAIDEFRAALAPAQEQLAGLSDKLTSLWEAYGPAFVAVFAIIGAVIIGVIGLITSFVAGVISAVAKVLPFIISIIEGIIITLTGIYNFITAFWQILQGLFTGNTEQVTQGFQSMKDAISLIWEGLWLGIRSVFEGFWVGLRELVSTVIESIVGFFTDLKDRLVGGSVIPEMLGEMFTAFTTWFSDITESLTTWVKERVAQFVDFFKDLKEKIEEFAKERLTGLTDFLTAIGTKVKDFFAERWKAFLDFLKEGKKKLEDIRKKLLSWIQDRLDDIEAGWVSIKVAFGEGWEKLIKESTYQMGLLMKSITTFVTDFIEVGEKLIGGMVQGVKNKIEDLVDEISNVVAAALDMAREALGERSPSREGIKIGENFGNAFVHGIVDSISRSLPEIAKIATKAAETISNSIGLNKLMPTSQSMMGLVTGSALNPNMRPAREGQSIDRSRTVNYNLTAQYRTEQSEARLIDDLSLLSAVTGGR